MRIQHLNNTHLNSTNDQEVAMKPGIGMNFGRRLPWPNRIAAGTSLAILMAATAFGQNHLSQNMQEVNAAAPVHPIPSAPKKFYTPGSAYAAPGLQCKLYAMGGAPSAGLDVSTDDDGYARFHAVRALGSDTVKQLSLDCTDTAGHSSYYSVDLTSDDTFAPRPLNLANERGIDRPALKGDPLSYPQSELIKAGYGLRPDPKKDSAAYSRWLTAASIAGRMLEVKRPSLHSHTVPTTTANPWVGSVMTGAPYYVSTEAVFNVPQAIPSGDETGGKTIGTEIAIWNGLGGFDTGSGLIQGGVGISTTPYAAVYDSWREYCCGDKYSNGYPGAFTPTPNDTIYSVEWYCDSQGNLNLKGGYGCTFLEDERTGAILSCTTPSTPCWSVRAIPGMVLGRAAEFVIEDQTPQVAAGWLATVTYTPGQIVDYGVGPYICLATNTNQPPPTNPKSWRFYPPLTPFTDFTPQVNMYGSAYSSQTGNYSQTISSDPVVYELTDFTNYTSHMSVGVGSSDNTWFNVSQWERVGGAVVSWLVPCPPGSNQDCYPQSIAVGPNTNGTTIGDPWVLGVNQIGNDYGIWHWENSTWVAKPGAATQIAISPQGVPWIINHLGQISYWNGSAFQLAPDNGCAIAIGVGPATGADPRGVPWVIGCDGWDNVNGSIYKLQASTWVKQPGAAIQIAVSPEGIPWVISSGGYIFHWNGSDWTVVNGCATSIAVGPSTAPLANPYGDVWVTGCGEVNSDGYAIYQFQNGTSWVQIPGIATQISVSPDMGVPWAVNAVGQVFE